MRRRMGVWGAAGIGIAVAGAASGAPITIDDFGNAQSLMVSGGLGPLSTDGGVAAAGALGGARFVSLNRTSGYGTDTLTVDGGLMHLLDLSSAAADTVTAALVYDGGTDNVLTPTGLGGIDLTDGGSNTRIRILARSDLVAPIAVTVYTDGGNFSTAVANLPGAGFGATPFTVIDLPFGAFLADMGAGADFQSVGAISVSLSGANTPSLDAQLDSIVAVPEPGTLALVGSGIVALAALGRLRARA